MQTAMGSNMVVKAVGLISPNFWKKEDLAAGYVEFCLSKRLHGRIFNDQKKNCF